MTLLLHVFDYCILIKYYNAFLGERRRGSRLFFLAYSSCIILLGMTVNLTGNISLNLVMACTTLFLTSLWYYGKNGIKICYFFVYLGIWAISEVITILIIGNIMLEQSSLNIYFAVAICQGIKYFIIMLLRTFKTEKNENLPRGTTAIMVVIFMGASIGCILINWKPIAKDYPISLISTLIIVSTFLLIYIFIFTLLDKFNHAFKLNYEQSLMIQESYLKDSYYREIDENNLQLRKLKHDFKNRLLAFSDLTDNNIEAAKDLFASMFDEINGLEGEIYTENNAINSICKVKFAKAKEKNIRISYEISLPERINICYGDLGILYGNLLDNAIEACEDLEEDLRYINFKTKTYHESLLFSIENGKGSNLYLEKQYYTTKKDGMNHGFGIKSVKDIVEKYNGIINIECNEQKFEINIVLYSITMI